MTRNVFLEDIPLDDAAARWQRDLALLGLDVPLPGEWIALEHALGRVTAEPVWGKISSPHYHAAAMDGYAVRAHETRGASETSPLRLLVPAQAVYVDTGNAMPMGFDAVVMIENVSVAGENIEILAPVAPWQHVRVMGEDMVAGELILPANHCLRPQDLGAVAGSNHAQVFVRRKPRVAILPTGTELVAPGQPLKPGDVIEYNSLVLGAMIETWGGAPTRLKPVADDFDLLKTSVLRALEIADLVVINAGSSAGSHDFVADVIRDIGQLTVHGIAIRPGHPVILGTARGKPVVGIPGYPASAIITFDLLVKPLIARWLGQPSPERPELRATLTRKVVSPLGEDEFLRVSVGKVDARYVATPLARGAGVVTSLVKADGIVRIPRFSEGFHAGDEVSVSLWRERVAIENTVVAVGSHDLALDVLADLLHQKYPHRSFTSANVGSYGGLLAVARGEAHVAGSHLLDESTGEYNVAAIQRVLPDVPVVLLGFLRRVQGLMVPRGNPQKITTLQDLTRPDVTFVNRQRGAGTRALLDFQLAQQGISPQQIQGYDRQEFTHLAVAASVKSGAADCALGIFAAARALDLDFIPLANERYDLVIPTKTFNDSWFQPVLDVIQSNEFRVGVMQLGGYDAPDLGVPLAVFDGGSRQ